MLALKDITTSKVNINIDSIRSEIYSDIKALLSPEESSSESLIIKNIFSSETQKLKDSKFEELLRVKQIQSISLSEYLESILNEKYQIPFNQKNLLKTLLINDLIYYGPISPIIFNTLKSFKKFYSSNILEDSLFIHLAGKQIQEIQINKFNEAYIITSSKQYKLEFNFISEKHLFEIAQRFINESNFINKQNYIINEVNPILDFELAFSSIRGSLISRPASRNTCLTLRFHPEISYDLINLIDSHMIDSKLAEFLTSLQEADINIAIAGTMGTGKTTLMNALIKKWKTHERKALLEDTSELSNDLNNLIQLQISNPKSENTSNNIKEIIKACKRHSIKYIALSEARDGDAWEIIQVAKSILACLMTFHYNPKDSNHKEANSALNTLSYLCSINTDSPDIDEIKSQIGSTIKILILLEQNSFNKKRYISSIHYIEGFDRQESKIFRTIEIVKYENGKFLFINSAPELKNYLNKKGVEFKF